MLCPRHSWFFCSWCLLSQLWGYRSPPSPEFSRAIPYGCSSRTLVPRCSLDAWRFPLLSLSGFTQEPPFHGGCHRPHAARFQAIGHCLNAVLVVLSFLAFGRDGACAAHVTMGRQRLPVQAVICSCLRHSITLWICCPLGALQSSKLAALHSLWHMALSSPLCCSLPSLWHLRS